METVKIGDRIFKECDDVSLAVKEKRKLFWINNGQIFDLRCVSEKYGPRKAAVFFYDNGDMGEQFLIQYRESGCAYNYKLYFDVTPEKRYAVWNKLTGKFIAVGAGGAATGSGSIEMVLRTRSKAEQVIQRYVKEWRKDAESLLKIVEFDNPDQE